MAGGGCCPAHAPLQQPPGDLLEHLGPSADGRERVPASLGRRLQGRPQTRKQCPDMESHWLGAGSAPSHALPDPRGQPAPRPAEPGRREGRNRRDRRAEPGRGPCARPGSLPGSPPMSWLKATRAETAPSYSWCLGRFINCVRHRADYFSGNKENRKADSTEPVTSCFRSGSHRPVWAGAGRHTGLLWQPPAVGLRLPLASGFQGPESRKAQHAGCPPGPSRPRAESPVRGARAERKRLCLSRDGTPPLAPRAKLCSHPEPQPLG